MTHRIGTAWLAIGLSTQILVGCGAESGSDGKQSARGKLTSDRDEPKATAPAQSPADESADESASDAGTPAAPEATAAATTTVGAVEEGVAIVTPEGDLSPLDDLIFVGSWTNALAPAACVAGLSNPIEGCDPAVDDTWDLDCDADGVADHVAYACNPADTERGPAFTGPYDCAPDDPAFSIWVARDQDGDGAIGDSTYNCAANPIPAGYVRALGNEAYDCDDTASTVFPAAVDTWNDGIDSDCGNGDAPACSVLDVGAAFPRAALDIGACEGADLHLLDLAQCEPSCSPVRNYYFLVTNTGAEASPAGRSVSWVDDTGDAGSVELPALAPGEASDAIGIPVRGAGTLTLELDFDDCTPSDTQLTRTREYYQCLR